MKMFKGVVLFGVGPRRFPSAGFEFDFAVHDAPSLGADRIKVSGLFQNSFPVLVARSDTFEVHAPPNTQWSLLVSVSPYSGPSIGGGKAFPCPVRDDEAIDCMPHTSEIQ